MSWIKFKDELPKAYTYIIVHYKTPIQYKNYKVGFLIGKTGEENFFDESTGRGSSLETYDKWMLVPKLEEE